MATVAKRLIGGLPASAETYRGTPRESEGLSFRIDDLEIAFDTKRAVVIYSDLGCGQFLSLEFHYIIPHCWTHISSGW
jgi:hypothetical protein